MLAATPLHGSHFPIDVLVGSILAVIAIAAADTLLNKPRSVWAGLALATGAQSLAGA